jgi:hypothetical protein
MQKEIIEEHELETRYEEMLDDCYELVKIGQMTYYPSQVLKECDPIAYRIGMWEYAESLAEDGVVVPGYTD